MCESEVEAAMPKIIDSTEAPTPKLCDIFIFGMTVVKKPLKMDINQKFQLTQFYFDSQRGFLYIKKLIEYFKTFGILPPTSTRIFSITVDLSKLKFLKISIFVIFLMVIFSAVDFINLPN